MTFIAVGISLMLFGSVQMMSVGLQDTFVGGLENEQTWDAQVYIMPDSENPVVEWAENYSVSYEMIIETPLGSVSDSNDVERMFTLVGLDSFTQGMRSVPIIDGKFPNADSAVPQVMMDEGSMIFLNWNVGDIRNVSINGVQIDVEIVAVSNAELARTMYFLRSDLSDIIGINATSIYLQLPNGVTVDSNLGEASVGIVERQTMLDGINDLLEQQSKAFDSMLFLGLLFTLVVMFNTMIMNIAERDFELATLRVLGASTWSIGTMLLFESILIGFIGGIVGIIFAFGGAVALASAFSSWQIFLPVSVDPGVALQIMGIVLVIAISMVPFGIWRIKRMDLVEKVKDLSQ
jgi:putative ABC transport system permease protein